MDIAKLVPKPKTGLPSGRDGSAADDPATLLPRQQWRLSDQQWPRFPRRLYWHGACWWGGAWATTGFARRCSSAGDL